MQYTATGLFATSKKMHNLKIKVSSYFFFQNIFNLVLDSD